MNDETIYVGSESFTDASGRLWRFGSAECDPDECAICSADVFEGWQCMDGGEVVCEAHLETIPEWMRDKLAEDLAESIDAHNRLVRMRCEIGLAVIACFQDAQHMPNRFLGWVTNG